MHGNCEAAENGMATPVTEEVVSTSLYGQRGIPTLQHAVLQDGGGGSGGRSESIDGVARAYCTAVLTTQVCPLTRLLAAAVRRGAAIRAVSDCKVGRVRYGFLRRIAVSGTQVAILASGRLQVSCFGP